MNRQTKFTMESGTTYTLVNDHHFRIKEKGGYEYAIKPWQWFAFDQEDSAVSGGVMSILNNAKRLDPMPGLRLMVWGRDEWRISTKIVKLETVNEEDYLMEPEEFLEYLDKLEEDNE